MLNWKNRVLMATFGRSDPLNEPLFNQVFDTLNPEQQQFVLRYFRDNKSMTIIAADFGISSKVAQKIMKDSLKAFGEVPQLISVAASSALPGLERRRTAGDIKQQNTAEVSDGQQNSLDPQGPLYYPNAEYTESNEVKRLREKKGYENIEAAVAVINTWAGKHTILWAWVDLVENRKRKETHVLKKEQGVWMLQ